MQIIVLGPHRSGTSAVTGLIHRLGAYFGPPEAAYPADDANPKGYWERTDIMQCNDQLLLAGGSAWCDLARWNPSAALPSLELMRRMKQIVMSMRDPWVMKDPRLCLTLPAWRNLLESPVAVLVYRDPVETALSLQRRDQFDVELGLALWEYYAAGALNASREMKRVFIRHAELLRDPHGALTTLHADLQACGVEGLRLPPPNETRDFIRPELHRAQSGDHASLSAHRQKLAAALRGEIALENASVSQESRMATQSYQWKR